MNKVECGRLGGRPRLATLEVIRQSELQKSQEIMKEDGYPGSNNLRELKRLWCKHRSSADIEIQEGTRVTPSLLVPGGKGIDRA